MTQYRVMVRQVGQDRETELCRCGSEHVANELARAAMEKKTPRKHLPIYERAYAEEIKSGTRSTRGTGK